VATDLAKYKALMSGTSGRPMDNSTILLVGPQSAGKTTLALTASDFCPDILPAQKLTDLEDIAVIPVDDGAVDSVVALKLRVPPKNIIPFGTILADVRHPIAAWGIAVDLARQTGANKLLGDSISQLDVLLQAWLNTEEGKKEWGGDKFAMFRYSLGAHQITLSKFKEFVGLRMATFHAQAALDDLDTKGQEKGATALKMDQAQTRKDKANGVIAQADLILGVTGKARDIWPRDASLVLGCVQEKLGDKYVRRVYTQFADGPSIVAKSRFEGILPAVLEENHLGKAIRMIREFGK
jgi:hypothetical protein